MKVFLVHADDGPGMAGRRETAVALARSVGGHVTLLVNTPFQRFVAMDPFGGAYLATEAFAEAKAHDAALVARLNEDMAGSGVSHDVISADNEAVGALASAASLADLAVVALAGAGSARADAKPMLAGDLALAAPIPVLALPETHAGLDPHGPALVAWNGRAEAAAALRAAIPLLTGRAITLLRIGADDGPITDAAALAYLARNGVTATLQVENTGSLSPGEMIEQYALAKNEALVVMGAFGRSRLRETLFGGVTQYLLNSARVPLLLAH